MSLLRQKRIWLASILIFLLSFPVYAHPGKTDSSGGHYVEGTTIYHYHHGYPAHYHTNGKCPYGFDDQTGANSGTSSKKDSDGTLSGSQSNESLEEESDMVLPIIFGVTCLIFLFILWKQYKSNKELKNKLQQQENRNQYLTDKNTEISTSLFKTQAQLTKLYQEKDSFRSEYIELRQKQMLLCHEKDALYEQIRVISEENRHVHQKLSSKNNPVRSKNEPPDTSEVLPQIIEAMQRRFPAYSDLFQIPIPSDTKKRLKSALDGKMEIVEKANGYVLVKSSSGKTYKTSLRHCSCDDCMYRGTPCKHMLFLMLNLSKEELAKGLSQEAYFYLKAANGMMVRVPESKLESWQRAQDEIRNGTYRVNEDETRQIMDAFGVKSNEHHEPKGDPR